MIAPASPGTPFFCQRDEAGNIAAISQKPMTAAQVLDGHWQAVSSGDEQQVQQFIKDETDHAHLLSQTDIGLVRVLEDLIEVLITRGVLQFTDLPPVAQAKLLERRQSRASLSHRLQLMSPDSEIGLL